MLDDAWEIGQISKTLAERYCSLVAGGRRQGEHVTRARLGFAVCANDPNTLRDRFLASECIQSGRYPAVAHFNAQSAAAAFNAIMASGLDVEWLVWVHQDVFLPPGWDSQFLNGIDLASQGISNLAIVGVYGIVGAGDGARRAGHILDRGQVLCEETPLPCRVDSLDELLFAVRMDSGLVLDEALGFDFYATDLVLSAASAGYSAAVVNAYCEHWSGMPRGGLAQTMAKRIYTSGCVFERKWMNHLPITTSCVDLRAKGDLAKAIEAMTGDE